jgi:hypothetical protein
MAITLTDEVWHADKNAITLSVYMFIKHVRKKSILKIKQCTGLTKFLVREARWGFPLFCRQIT